MGGPRSGRLFDTLHKNALADGGGVFVFAALAEQGLHDVVLGAGISGRGVG